MWKKTVVFSLVPFVAGCSSGEDTQMAEKLCKVVKDMAPKSKNLGEIGTQAQLVMNVAGAFEANPEKLGMVMSKIDELTTKSCPNERKVLLDVLKKGSLAEAVR